MDEQKESISATEKESTEITVIESYKDVKPLIEILKELIISKSQETN